MAIKELTRVFEALANETRLRIIRLIHQEGGAYCGALTEKLNLSQPAVSHHLNILKNAGILTVKNEGAKHCYELDKEFLKELGLDFLRRL